MSVRSNGGGGHYTAHVGGGSSVRVGTGSSIVEQHITEEYQFYVLGLYETLEDLISEHPTGEAGDAYAVGTVDDNEIYVWNREDEAWQSIGTLRGPAGPNSIGASTATDLTGVLAGNGSTVTTKPVDSRPTASSQNLVTSGGVLIEIGSAASLAQSNAELFTMNALGTAEGAVAILSNNNTHAAITTGQYVYVRGHSTLSEGLYVATENIAANASLSTSNLTAVSGGGLNAISDYLKNSFCPRVYDHYSTTTTGQTHTTTFGNGLFGIFMWVSSARANTDMAFYLLECSTSNHRTKIATVIEGADKPFTMAQSDVDVTFTSTATYAVVDIIKFR